MREKLSLQNIMSHFRERWSKLPDTRKPNNNTQYSIATGVLSAFAVFFMQSASFLAHQRLLEKKKGRSNARSLFQVEEIPSDLQIRNLLDPLGSSNFQEDFWFLLDGLKEQGHLQQFRTELDTYAIPMDGMTFFSSEKIDCPYCLKREDRTGKVHFYHSAITPVIVKSGKAQVLPLPPEFIVPQDGSEKQDCERMAAKRWLSQHHQHFADHSVTYLGDDLYANQPLCQLIAQTYHQFFIFTCKPESHAGLYDQLAFLDKNNGIEKVTQRHWNGKHGEIWTYRFANQVPLRNGSDALLVNWLELVITHEKTGEILYQNSFVTNHMITSTNVIQIVEVGRTRWKIENENNNTLTPALAGGARETKGYHLEHNFGHGQQNLANVLATLNILAFFIHTIQELLEPAYQRLRRALGARKTFFDDLRALTRYMVFETWDDLFSFMEEGLEISPDPPG
jgi:hypothetical protein